MMKPVKKAYQINTSNLDWQHESVARGYVLEPFYAQNEKEARLKGLKFLRDDCGVEDDDMDDPLTYISIKVKRIPSYDLFKVEGSARPKTKGQIEMDQKMKIRDDGFRKLLEDNPDASAYILKGGYYYIEGYRGHTERKHEAGVYTLISAVNECIGMSESDYMRPELIDKDEHNSMILSKIEYLKKNLIK